MPIPIIKTRGQTPGARAKATIEPKRRFVERLDNPAKNRKFSSSDARQRVFGRTAYRLATDSAPGMWFRQIINSLAE
jgi:hypothetical protein